MTFLNSVGEKVNISIAGVKADLTQAEVSALMDTIIAKDIFFSKNGALSSKYDAQMTQRTVTKFTVA
jgi:Protein of unknown function (DUF2922)